MLPGFALDMYILLTSDLGCLFFNAPQTEEAMTALCLNKLSQQINFIINF